MRQELVNNCKTTIDAYQTDYTIDKSRGNNRLLKEFKQSFNALTQKEREVVILYVREKSEQIRPIKEIMKEVQNIAIKTTLGAILVPTIDAYLHGGTSLARKLGMGLFGGITGGITAMRCFKGPEEDYNNYRKLRPITDIYHAIWSAPNPAEQVEQDVAQEPTEPVQPIRRRAVH